MPVGLRVDLAQSRVLFDCFLDSPQKCRFCANFMIFVHKGELKLLNMY